MHQHTNYDILRISNTCTVLLAALTTFYHQIRTRISKKVRWYVVIPACVLVSTIVAFGFAWGGEANAYILNTIQNGVNFLVIASAQLLFFFSTVLISLTVFALKFFVLLAGYNGYSIAPIVELGWTLVRDVANMFFIVALLVIAFATILGREDYALKKTLGKLVLMAIFINFSKLISQVIIDAAHVVTMTFLNALSAVAGGNLIRMFKFDSMRSLLTAGVSTDETQNPLPFQLLGASFLTFMMTMTALFMLGVYFIVMLYRVVMLWVLIIFSPIAYAAAALPATANISRDWWSEFTKNVISAPMMVFFMWLAFATIGNGAVLGQITDTRYNSLPDVETAAFAESETFDSRRGTETNQATFAPTVSQATTWSNMAGFAVAIAFLWAGIEQVQKLGVRGADNLTTAKDWAMKGALGVSAFATGGWWLKKNGERFVKNEKNRMKIRGAKFSAFRDQTIDKLGIPRIPGGNMLKSARYKDKISSDWEKAAESAEQIYDTKVSTGASNAGKKKLNLGEKAAMARERNEVSGAAKRAQERLKILASEAKKAGIIQDEAKNAQAQLDVDFEKDKNDIVGDTSLSDDDRKEQLAQLTKKHTENTKAVADRREKAMASQAYYTNLETEKVNKAGKARERQIAAKESVLRAGGLDPKYIVQYEQELYEEREKEFANLRPSEFLGKAEVYARQAQDSTLSDEERKSARDKARALLIAAQKKGSFEAGQVLDGFEAALSDADKLKIGNTSTRDGMQKFLTKSLGYSNFQEFHNAMDPAEMRQFQTSAEHTAKDGDTRTVGIFNKVYDKVSQREVLEVNTDNEKHTSETVGRATYTSPSQLTGSAGLVSVKFKDDKKGGVEKVVSIETDEDIERMVAAYRSLQGNTQLHQDNIASLQAIRDADGRWDEFMSELEKVSDKAAQALKDKITPKITPKTTP